MASPHDYDGRWTLQVRWQKTQAGHQVQHVARWECLRLHRCRHWNLLYLVRGLQSSYAALARLPKSRGPMAHSRELPDEACMGHSGHLDHHRYFR